MIPDNQLARGIQSKTVWDMGLELPVRSAGGQAPPLEGWDLGGGGATLTYKINCLCSPFDGCFLAYIPDDFKPKKNVVRKIFDMLLAQFLSKLSYNFLIRILIWPRAKSEKNSIIWSFKVTFWSIF